MDLASFICIILAFCGVITEHTALIVCLIYLILYFILCVVKGINGREN